MDCLFYALVGLMSVILPGWFVVSVWREAHGNEFRKQWNWINPDTRNMYLDIFKTVSSAGTIAAALVSAVISTSPTGKAAQPTARISVAALVMSTLFSLTTIICVSRFYDRARSRFQFTDIADSQKVAGRTTEMGQLTDAELRMILFSAFFAFAGSAVGFLYLARIVFLA
jgi:hypothetical protein